MIWGVLKIRFFETNDILKTQQTLVCEYFTIEVSKDIITRKSNL